jgi:hypothetical protein
VIIDFLLSKDGLRLAKVDLALSGVRMGRAGTAFAPQVVDEVTGEVHLALADLGRALARPEIVDQLVGGVAGLARAEIEMRDGEEPGTVRLVGSVEAMGRRVAVRASTRLSVDRDRLVFGATHLEGIPLLGSLPVQPFDLVLPLALPPGMHFTGVTTQPGIVVLAFAGRDVAFPTGGFA